MEERLDEDGGEEAGGERRSDADVNVPAAVPCPGLHEEGQQRTHDENRLETFADEQHERLEEEGERRGRPPDQLFRTHEARTERVAHRFESGAPRAGPGAQLGERDFELTGQLRIPRAHRALERLERHVGIQRLRGRLVVEAGRGEHDDRIDLPANLREGLRDRGTGGTLRASTPHGGEAGEIRGLRRRSLSPE